jgi:hypothetical protein
MTTNIDPIMSRFHAALDKIFGEQVERVVRFGSRAVGVRSVASRAVSEIVFCLRGRPD